MRSIVYHQAAGRCTLARDEIQPRRGWWYTPHFARWWYTKPAAWINKKGTFGRQKFLFCWWRQQGSNLRPHGCEPCALTNWAMLPSERIILYHNLLQIARAFEKFFRLFSIFSVLFVNVLLYHKKHIAIFFLHFTNRRKCVKILTNKNGSICSQKPNAKK